MKKANDNSFWNWLHFDENKLDDELNAVFDDETPARPEPALKPAATKQLEEETIQAQAELQQRRAPRVALRKAILYRGLAVLLVLAIAAFLFMTVYALPTFGAADNPYNNEVSRRYIEKGIEETGAINFVAGMILDYRAFDTFGESIVLFIAASTVIMLLRINEDSTPEERIQTEADDRRYEPKRDPILCFASGALTPMILLLGIYIVLNGHLGPGGGFSGGAVMGGALVLYLCAFGFQKSSRFFTYRTFRVITFCALMCYGGLKSYSFFCGANGLETGISLGTPGAILSSGLILPLNICVGLVVMCTMYAFYTLLRKGGMEA